MKTISSGEFLFRQEAAFADRAVELASVGVAANADVDGSQAGLFGIFHFGG